MFCNEIEGALFSPLPPSLWTDYYNDQSDEDDFFRKGIMRNYQSSARSKQLLPSLHHFRSLPQSNEGDGMGFLDECDSTDDGSKTASVSSGSLTSSPVPNHSGQAVKSLFHDGCLFAYSPPRKHSHKISRLRNPPKRENKRGIGKQTGRR